VQLRGRGGENAGPRTPEELRTVLVSRYEQGSSVREVAEATGRSYWSVYYLLRRAGVNFRRPGGGTRSARSG
jgi:DNA-directed RNA polymerase specialized sigma24 family protein